MSQSREAGRGQEAQVLHRPEKSSIIRRVRIRVNRDGLLGDTHCRGDGEPKQEEAAGKHGRGRR